MAKKKKDDDWAPGEEIELEQEFIVLAIPATTLEVKIEAKIYYKGDVRTVESTMDYNDVRAAIKEAQDGYIPSDALFQITPAGEKYLEELRQRYRDEDDSCI